MSKSTDKLCELCGQQPATSGGLWYERVVVQLCEACLTTALAYEYLIDSLQKGQCAPEQVTQQAIELLKDMRERMGLRTELPEQTLAALGVKLTDTCGVEK